MWQVAATQGNRFDLFSGQGLTIGEAMMRAKAAVASGDVRRTWILLGDPTMKLR